MTLVPVAGWERWQLWDERRVEDHAIHIVETEVDRHILHVFSVHKKSIAAFIVVTDFAIEGFSQTSLYIRDGRHEKSALSLR